MLYRADRVDAVFLISLRSVRGKKILDDARSFTTYMSHTNLAFSFFDNLCSMSKNHILCIYPTPYFSPLALISTAGAIRARISS